MHELVADLLLCRFSASGNKRAQPCVHTPLRKILLAGFVCTLLSHFGLVGDAISHDPALCFAGHSSAMEFLSSQLHRK